jgi:hypothetical protein
VDRHSSWQAVTTQLNEQRGGTLWNSFKTLTSTGKGTTRSLTRLKDEHGVLTSDPTAVSNIFAKCLEATHRKHDGPEFCNNMLAEVETHVRLFNTRYTPCTAGVTEDGDQDPLVDEIDVTKLRSALSMCKNNSSAGRDGIKYVVLKKLPHCTVSQLAKLFSACIYIGYFPAEWKSAVGVMLPKPEKDTREATSYRPISLLNTMGKLLEKIVVKRLTHHLEEANFFNPYQRASSSSSF